MKVSAILLCVAIGSVFGKLVNSKFGIEQLEVTEDVKEVPSLISLIDDKNTNGSNESLRVKYAKVNKFSQIGASAKDGHSIKQKTSRIPSPVIVVSTMKPTSPKAIKKNLETMYIRKHGRKVTSLASRARRLLRRKRMAEVEDPTDVPQSFRLYRKLYKKLPAQLRKKIWKTDCAEHDLLTSYATSDGNSSNRLADYNSAKSAEREQLKVEASGPGATEVIDNYKALRKAKSWNYVKLRRMHKGFFEKPSPSLSDYEALKQGEVATIDSFLDRSSNTETEKPIIAEPHEKETTTDVPDWISLEPADFIGFLPRKPKPDDNAEKDSHMFDKDIDENANVDESNCTTWKDVMASNKREYTLQKHLSQDIAVEMSNSDTFMNELLFRSMAAGKFRQAFLDLYYKHRRLEIEALKAHLATKPPKLRDRILFIYKQLRKGKPWFSEYGPFTGTSDFFNGSVPKQAVDKYFAVRREELYTDQYLDGSMKIGEVPKKDEKETEAAFEGASNQAESEEAHRELRVEASVIARSEEDDDIEEMQRGVRAKETERVEVDYDADRENDENVVATTDDYVEVHGISDNVTSADVMNTETTTKARDNSDLLRFAILFAMASQALIIFIILRPQMDKLVEWCKRRKRTEPSLSETEPLQVKVKASVIGPTDNPQPRLDAAKGYQRARV